MDKSLLEERTLDGKYGRYTTWKVETENLPDQWHTILMMAKKRAKTAAVWHLPLVSAVFVMELPAMIGMLARKGERFSNPYILADGQGAAERQKFDNKGQPPPKHLNPGSEPPPKPPEQMPADKEREIISKLSATVREKGGYSEEDLIEGFFGGITLAEVPDKELPEIRLHLVAELNELMAKAQADDE